MIFDYLEQLQDVQPLKYAPAQDLVSLLSRKLRGFAKIATLASKDHSRVQ
jgi:hypothetical protein